MQNIPNGKPHQNIKNKEHFSKNPDQQSAHGSVIDCIDSLRGVTTTTTKVASDIRWNRCLRCKPLHIPNEATCEITAVRANQRSMGHQRCCWSESESTIRLSIRRKVKYRLSRSSHERLCSLSAAASYPDNTARSLVAAVSSNIWFLFIYVLTRVR